VPSAVDQGVAFASAATPTEGDGDGVLQQGDGLTWEAASLLGAVESARGDLEFRLQRREGAIDEEGGDAPPISSTEAASSRVRRGHRRSEAPRPRVRGSVAGSRVDDGGPAVAACLPAA
jgi:hypothetical protein